MGEHKVIDTPTLKFISMIEGLTFVPDALPKPSQKFIPQWWKNLPYEPSAHSLDTSVAGNIKTCPSFIDYFTKGFMMPMWTDMILKYSPETNEWRYKTSDKRFTVDYHSNEQYLDFVEHKFLGDNTYFVFKLLSPWKIITPKGYSTLQLPATYHFNDDFSVMTGVRDTDIYHNLNIQLLIHSPNKEIFIPRGTPLAHFFPYKRLEETLEVLEYKDSSDNDKRLLQKSELNMATKFVGSGSYKHMGKESHE